MNDRAASQTVAHDTALAQPSLVDPALLKIGGQVFEYQSIPPSRAALPTLVLLHEALGSVALWRDFPERIALATGCQVLSWSRQGYGHSSPLAGPRTPRYLHDEAIEQMPAVLAALQIDQPVLIGHSDGGSIALIHAAAFPDRVAGLVVIAPHEFVEHEALAGIRRAGEAYASGRLRNRLAAFHRDADRVFDAWHDTWLSENFRDWDIRDCLPAIRCPILAIQGEDDEYATMRQIECIAESCADVELLKLADCRHSPHRDQPERVIAAIVRFVDRLSTRGDKAPEAC
ncbi:alpha/beta fold hydrolase [Accumulibacter sp.]|uniref:alpha/beta fold hydrolase n=1 Tax=Accumulibacter sp. TaxID=2053492 RepID=UPI0025F59AD9|nr:alpha/beta hydrolase [Accumulibacter sp.]MCM8593742.1 alpha/beta hydrolase [Accumulibacter sp.]MCM8627722.1 alpha/beta hydrolase [Accumulibacter sp.]MDS4047881.1 alpha/beta hydrolase [Accumulibacter sp.]